MQILRQRLDDPAYRDTAGDLLLAGLLAGVAVGAVFGVRRSGGLENIFQRGVVGVLSAVGGLLVGFFAAPLNGLLGIAGMIGWAAGSLVLGIAGSRWATAGSREGGP